MATLSAADLQKRHALEGAPDPFPSLTDDSPRSIGSTPSSSNGPSSSSNVKKAPAPNTSSEDAFPSLGPSAPAPVHARAPPSIWGSSGASKARTAPPPVKHSGALDTLSIVVGPQTDRDGKVIPLGTIMRQVQEKTGTAVEASTQKKTGLTQFVVKGPNVKAVEQAKKLLTSRLSKVITITVEAPISTLGSIIGPKGTTLRQITDSTGCRINIPKREDASSSIAPTPAGSDNGSSSDDDDDLPASEPTVEITITGPTPSAQEAQTQILAHIGNRVSKDSKKIKDVPASYFPFIAQRVQELESGKEVRINIPPPAMLKAFRLQAEQAENGAAENGEEVVVNGHISKKDLAIVVTGEKEAVKDVVSAIHNLYEDLKSSTTTLAISIPKRQHRFLVGSNADEILATTGCVVELPSIEDTSDQVVIRGPTNNLSQALGAVVTKANAVAVESLDLASLHRSPSNPFDTLSHSKALLRYLIKTGQFRKVADAHAPTRIFPPFPAAIDASGQVVVELVGEDREKVAAAKKEIQRIAKALGPSRVEKVEIDHLVHRFLIGKKGAKVNQFHSQHGVEVIFPLESQESSSVVLIYAPADADSTDAKVLESQAKEKLALVKEELLKLAKEAADLKTSTLDVEAKWHRAIIGTGGTNLNAIIGEDKLVSVRVGTGKNDTSSPDADTITIRGPAPDVDRVEKEILQIVHDAKNDLIINGHVVEFTVDRAHVGHLVGSSGAAINKLRDDLGVKVQFDDAVAAAPTENGDKKKKNTAPTGGKAICKITGRKESVAAAKVRILAQVEKLADETSISVTIPKKFHSGLIGSSGKYAIRLEEKYGVKITFPKADREGSDQKPDEVLIRGGKKGVASAKAELLEAAEYEKETGQTVSFTIPSRAVARVLGKAGSQITEIKEDTETQIDVEKADSSTPTTTITIRGTTKGIKAAKLAILAVAETVGEETNSTVSIEHQFHRSLIGAGGSRLREIIVSCGGPEEARAQAGLVSFPKGEASDEVRLRGEPGLVSRLKVELTKIVAELKDRVIVGVSVPVASHASKIGRGGSALLDLQKKTNTTIQFPGSRQYASFGEIENAADLADADPKTVVKVAGSKSAVAAAVEELSKQPEGQAARAPREAQADQLTATVQVPQKLVYHIVGDRGFFFRNLRNSGVIVESPPTPPKPETPTPSKSSSNGASNGRIDIDEDEQYSSDIDYIFEIFPRYAGQGDETVEWTLKSRNQQALDKGIKTVEDAIKSAEANGFIGVIAGLPQSSL
ncbi:hypothetical protein BDY24DRAFT_382512 [Mrakia frigida]|uniref:Scp160p n=1 Tax=Mrakia frigida TaxID=29902 RepID=UPI003FCC1615